MRRVITRWIFGVLGLLLLTSCAQPTSSPTAVSEEELPPPVTMSVPFNVSPTEQPTTGRPPSLYLNPANVSLGVGETTTIQVWADGVGGVNSLFLVVGFDPLLIQVVDADPLAEGIQAAAGDLMTLVLDNKVEGNRLVYHAAVQPGAAAKDAGILVSLSLRAIAPGTTSLRMEQVTAQDGMGNPVPVTPLADGALTITGTVSPPAAGTPPPPTPQPTIPVTPVPSGAGGIYYIVGPGENLFRIGLKFGTTAQAIAAANNIADPRQVPAGMMILVPVPAPGGGYGYYVRPGDTVYSIARRFGMTVEELVSLNNIGPDFAIHPDTILKVVPRR
ncbi:MAG: LysM peptidoglycan-binding domain-containing protein [Anaerolineae bacterium]|nr:LysM peptidoglycan-binding domain-containing protein [Anaerolineae bacterium]